MAFPPQFLDEIRARLSLSDLVGRRVKLTRRGREYTGLCPFHNEKTPSFTVNNEKSFFHCFGCGSHGDVLGWVMQADGLSFPEAVERLAAEAGLEMPVETPEARERDRARAGLAEAMEAACVFYEKALWAPQGREALAYLRGRALSDETIRRFRLGFAAGGNALRAHLQSAEMPEPLPEALLLEGGLIRKPDDGRPTYDFFRDRVLFPILDGRGRVIAFGGRTMGDGEPKYLNSPDTPLFDKRRTLYGLSEARRAAHEKGRVIVTEGYMDVIALSQAGLAEAVAPLGTALSESHIEALWRLAPEPFLCFDGDNAGIRAAARAAERALPLLAPERSLRFVTLPKGEDPDSLVRTQGPQAMEEALARAVPLDAMIWTIETEGREIDTPERLAGLEARLEERAHAIADRKVQARYLTAFRDRLRDFVQARRDAARGQRGGGRGGYGAYGAGGARTAGGFPQNNFANRGGGGFARRPGGGGFGAGSGGNFGGGIAPARAPAASPALLKRRLSQALLATVINHPGILDMFAEDLAMVNVSDPMLDNLRQEILKVYAANTDLDSDTLKNHLRVQGNPEAVDSVLGQDVFVHAGFARDDAAEEAARAGFLQVLSKHLEPHRRAEFEEAKHLYVNDPTEENWNRFEKLKADRTAPSGPGDASA